MKSNSPLKKPLLCRHETECLGEVYSFLGGSVGIYCKGSPFEGHDNEDALAVIPIDESRGVLVVADGVGGALDGGEASKIVVEELVTELKAFSGESLREGILKAVDEANQKIIATGKGSGTTLLITEIENNNIRSYHAGDSSLVVMGSRGKVKLTTVDHSPTGYGLDAGLLTPQEAMVHEERNVVLNVLGCKEMFLQMGSYFNLSQRDTLLLATDGLWDNLTLSEVCEISRKGTIEKALQTLVDTCQKRMMEPHKDVPSKPDDLSLILFRLK